MAARGEGAGSWGPPHVDSRLFAVITPPKTTLDDPTLTLFQVLAAGPLGGRRGGHSGGEGEASVRDSVGPGRGQGPRAGLPGQLLKCQRPHCRWPAAQEAPGGASCWPVWPWQAGSLPAPASPAPPAASAGNAALGRPLAGRAPARPHPRQPLRSA